MFLAEQINFLQQKINCIVVTLKGCEIMEKENKRDSGHSFEDYFKRATSPMMTLLLLNEKPMYVYNLSQELEKRSNSTYKMNFLYPVLYRLQQQGYVTEFSQEITEGHRTRNYYSITDEGREYLDAMIKKYRELLSAVDIILTGSGEVETSMPTESGLE